MLFPSGSKPGMTIDNRLTVFCNTGVLQMKTIQRAGKSPITANAFLSGNSVPLGTMLR